MAKSRDWKSMKEVEWKYIMVDLPQLMQELNTGKRRRKEEG